MVEWISLLSWLVPVIAILWIGIDFFITYKKGKFKDWERNLKENIEETKKQKTNWKAWMYVGIVALLVFGGFKILTIGQNTIQECEVWIDNGIKQEINNNYMIMNKTAFYEYFDAVDKLEQGRSLNYYNQFFKEKGKFKGLSIKCNLSWSIERFKKNLLLDYNKGYKEDG